MSTALVLAFKAEGDADREVLDEAEKLARALERVRADRLFVETVLGAIELRPLVKAELRRRRARKLVQINERLLTRVEG